MAFTPCKMYTHPNFDYHKNQILELIALSLQLSVFSSTVIRMPILRT